MAEAAKVTVTVELTLNHAVPLALLKNFVVEAIERYQSEYSEDEAEDNEDPLVDAIESATVTNLQLFI
jgi:hypothetical protein